MSERPVELMKKSTLVLSVVLVVTAAVWFIALPRLYVVPVLTYHMIGYPETERMRANTVTPESFKKQMAFIKKHGYRALSLDEYYEGLKAGKNFCCHSAVITLDDGMLDNYTEAFPVLKEFGIPAAFFVPTAKIGMADQMTWDQLKEITASRITVGSHTQNHLYLPDFPKEVQMREIVESKKAIESHLGMPAYYFAYPIGGFNEDVKKMARAAGYRLAFTTNRGQDCYNHDLFELKRIRSKDTDNDLVMWLKLTGYYNLLRMPRKSF